MRNITILLMISLLAACGKDSKSIDEIKATYGDFGNGTIKYLSIDYTKTPINKAVEHHPEEYTYLDAVDIFSIGHMSDGLFVTGLMVAPKKKGRYPVIVFNRGGNRDLGILLVSVAVNELAPLAAQGYVVVATNYRGNSRGEGVEEFGGSDLNDVSNLIKS
ncbi:MAG TPA: hypothetical protein VJ911_02175, partial [Cryomorphaceae bacterium]|nr:hypothetical protein [Cryomorphaceae bacterium]